MEVTNFEKPTENEEFCCAFHITIGGEIYHVKDSSRFVAVQHNVAFDETGPVKVELGEVAWDLEERCLMMQVSEEMADWAQSISDRFQRRKAKETLIAFLSHHGYILVSELQFESAYLISKGGKHYVV